MASTTFAPNTEMRLFNLNNIRLCTAKVLENGNTFQVWPSKMTFNTTADWIAHQNNIHDERLSLFIESVAVTYVLPSDTPVEAATVSTPDGYSVGTKLRLYKGSHRITTAVILKDGSLFQVWPTRGGTAARRYDSVEEWQADWQDRRGEMELEVTLNTPQYMEEEHTPSSGGGGGYEMMTTRSHNRSDSMNTRSATPHLTLGKKRAAAAGEAQREFILTEMDQLRSRMVQLAIELATELATEVA